MMNKIKKLFVSLLGFLVFILLLEVVLRIGGSIMLKRRDAKAQVEEQTEQTVIPQHEGEEYKVMCIGNCYTFGVGAPKGQSYPDHLRELFITESRTEKVKIINKGLPGLNSGVLLASIDVHLDEIRPDMVILRTGSPNLRDHRKYGTYLARESINVQDKAVATKMIKEARRSMLYDFFNQLHTVRLAVYMIEDVRVKKSRESKEGTLLESPEAKIERVDLKARERDGEVPDVFDTELGDLHSRIKDPQKMVPFLGNINSSKYYIRANQYLDKRDYNAALSHFVSAIKTADTKSVRMKNKLYGRLRFSAKHADTEMIQQLIAQNRESYPDIVDCLPEITVEKTLDWVISDLHEIVKKIRSRGIKLILINYPLLPPEEVYKNYQEWKDNMATGPHSDPAYHDRNGPSVGHKYIDTINWNYWRGSNRQLDFMNDVNEVLRDYALDNSLIFIDIENKFNYYIRNSIYDAPPHKRHPNGDGYRLMAQEVYKEILKFIPDL